jgi:hypothetical protein
MGVTFYVKQCQLFIDQSQVWDAYFAVMEWYHAHQDNPYYFNQLGANDLAEALAFGWAVTFDEAQNVIAIEDRVASISPLRAESLIEVFTPLAPFIRAGSCIVISHDDMGEQLFLTTLRFNGESIERETDTI